MNHYPKVWHKILAFINTVVFHILAKFVLSSKVSFIYFTKD